MAFNAHKYVQSANFVKRFNNSDLTSNCMPSNATDYCGIRGGGAIHTYNLYYYYCMLLLVVW